MSGSMSPDAVEKEIKLRREHGQYSPRRRTMKRWSASTPITGTSVGQGARIGARRLCRPRWHARQSSSSLERAAWAHELWRRTVRWSSTILPRCCTRWAITMQYRSLLCRGEARDGAMDGRVLVWQVLRRPVQGTAPGLCRIDDGQGREQREAAAGQYHSEQGEVTEFTDRDFDEAVEKAEKLREGRAGGPLERLEPTVKKTL